MHSHSILRSPFPPSIPRPSHASTPTHLLVSSCPPLAVDPIMPPAAASALPTDTVNSYHAIRAVGHGDMGAVFLAVHAETEKSFALKVMCKDALLRRNNTQRSDTELQILSTLNHPFLPVLHDHFETDRFRVFVMDFCSGRDLNVLRHKQPEGKFSEGAVRFYGAEVVLALEHLHGLGLAYRDLKPENLLIQSSGHIMVADFDLSIRLPPAKREASPPKSAKKGKGSYHKILPCAIPDQCEDAVRTIPACMPSPRSMKSQGSKPHHSSTRVTPLEGHKKGKGSYHQMLPCTIPDQFEDAVRTIPACMPSPRSMKSQGSKPQQSSTRVTPLEGRKKGRAFSFVGTAEYMAPEVLLGTGHDFSVDWWTLGVLLYEMLHGRTPFSGPTRKDTFLNILSRDPELPGPWTPLHDLIRSLLSKLPERRLGFSHGAAEIKSHSFFCDVQWDILEHVARPPFVPPPISVKEMADGKLDLEEYMTAMDLARCERGKQNNNQSKCAPT